MSGLEERVDVNTGAALTLSYCLGAGDLAIVPRSRVSVVCLPV